MSFVDDYFQVKELSWLNEVARKNEIPKRFCEKKIARYLKSYAKKEMAFIKKM